MNKVKIMITGSAPREFSTRPGETLRSLVARLSTRGFPLGRVGDWYCDSVVVPSTKAVILQDGMVLAGAPAMKPTSFTMRCFGHEWKAWIDQQYGSHKGLDTVLLEAVGFCLKHSCPNMAPDRRNELARDALMVQNWYADGELIEDPPRFQLVQHMIISAGRRRSKTPIVKLDMTPSIDIHIENVRRARKLGRVEQDLEIGTLRITPGEMLSDFISRLNLHEKDLEPRKAPHPNAGQRLVMYASVHGEDIKNPSTFALKSGMPIRIGWSYAKDAAAS